MSSDTQFTAVGPASPRFQTGGDVPDVGANISGASTGGAFWSTASTPGGNTAAVRASGPFGAAIVAGNANDDSTLPDRPRGLYAESYVAGGVGVEGIGSFAGVAAQLGGDPTVRGWLAGRDPLFGEAAGVYGESPKQGLTGVTTSDVPLATGVFGTTKTGNGIGVRGETVGGVAVQGKAFGAGLAGNFVGNVDIDGVLAVTKDVNVSGNVNVIGDVTLSNRDLAERFRISTREPALPGFVMVVEADGLAAPCTAAYDRRAIGVVSGAGTLRPAITLGVDGDPAPACAIALSGTVNCLVDADLASIEIGDLLTASPTRGHAMKADDLTAAFGAVIGKALGARPHGKGLVPMLVMMR